MNQAINFFWTILCFIPVITFWYGNSSYQMMYALIGISVFSLFVPASRFQLSTHVKFYERLGVKLIRKLVQGGDFANELIRRKDPQHKTIKNRAHVAGYQRTVMMYERFHFACFIFFLLTSVFAVIADEYLLSTIILLANIIYNICPILLQQYNRARVSRIIKRSSITS